jgi:serine/threonine-protein kinase
VVQRQLDQTSQDENRFLGVAHGRAGSILAQLRWIEAARIEPPDGLVQQLGLLRNQAQQRGAGLTWPIDVTDTTRTSWTGWCHGSAGHLLVFTTAARVLQNTDFLDVAIDAGNHIWELRGHSGPSLCCGCAGEALSLFDLARATGDAVWIDRGLELVTNGINTVQHIKDGQGLFRSEVGVALAAAESIEPAVSTWPICQSLLS